MSIDELRDKVKQELIHMGTEYLYKLKKEPKTFALKGAGRDMKDREHSWKVKELRFGKAMMILRICESCSHGEIEVFPPLENRMVIQ